jgi:hypothetical protein
VAQQICERIADGQSLRTICSDKDMPDKSSVLLWLRTYDEFSTQYARAREEQADAMDDEILDTARSTTNENAQAARVQIDAFKWRAARLAPKKYGDKLDINANVSLTTDPEERRARLAELLGKAQGLQTGAASVKNNGGKTTEGG